MSRSLGCLVFCLALASGSASATTIQDFDSAGTPFTITQHWQPPTATILGGGPEGNFLRLANSGVNNQLNSIAFDLTDPGAYPTIVADFDFRMVRAGSGADAIGIVLLNTSVFGISAAPSLPLFRGSISVAFDIFQNPESGDPNNNFVRVALDGAVVADILPGVSLASGEFLHAQLSVQAIAGGADLTLVLATDGGIPVTAVDELFISGYLPYEARVGFWARTGDLTANHDVDNVAVQFLAAVPEPGTAALVALGLAILSWSR